MKACDYCRGNVGEGDGVSAPDLTGVLHYSKITCAEVLKSKLEKAQAEIEKLLQESKEDFQNTERQLLQLHSDKEALIEQRDAAYKRQDYTMLQVGSARQMIGALVSFLRARRVMEPKHSREHHDCGECEALDEAGRWLAGLTEKRKSSGEQCPRCPYMMQEGGPCTKCGYVVPKKETQRSREREDGFHDNLC